MDRRSGTHLASLLGMMTIFLVDDDTDMLDILSDLFLEEGYGVVTASSGRAALDLFVPQQFDLLILDYKLGEMDGFHVVNRIRLKDAALPVIMMSAMENESVKEWCRNLGITAFLEKPFDLIAVMSLVNAIFKKRQRRC